MASKKMTGDEVLKAVASILSQYYEEDIDGEPISIDCDLAFATSCRYRWYGNKFDNLRHNYDPNFLAVVEELRAQGYSAGYGAKLKPRMVVDADCEAEEYHITIYGDCPPPFNEYKGYKVGHSTRPPIFI